MGKGPNKTRNHFAFHPVFVREGFNPKLILLFLPLERNGTRRRREFSLESDSFSKLECLREHERFLQISERTASGFLSSRAWSPASSPGTLADTSGISELPRGFLNVWVPERPYSHLVKSSSLCSRGLETGAEVKFSEQSILII